MGDKSAGIEAPNSANVDGSNRNFGGGGGGNKNNSVFATSLRELSQPNYYRYLLGTLRICEIVRLDNFFLNASYFTVCILPV